MSLCLWGSYQTNTLKKIFLNPKILKMELAKKLAIDLLIVTAGVLIALKLKEQWDKAKIAAPVK